VHCVRQRFSNIQSIEHLNQYYKHVHRARNLNSVSQSNYKFGGQIKQTLHHRFHH